MKKRIYICLVLLVCLLLTSTGCSLNISLQFGNDQSDAAEGTGAFPEELSEEDRAKWDQAVKDALENADFGYLEQKGFTDPFANPNTYFAVRSLNQEVVEDRYNAKEEDMFSASEGFLVHVPVFSEVDGVSRIVGMITLRQNKDQGFDVIHDEILSKDRFAKQDLAPYEIFEKAPSFAYLEEYCSDHSLGILQSVSIVDVWWLHHLETVIFLETSQGSYIYDPSQFGERLDLNSISQDGVPLYESDKFVKAYLREQDRQASATGDAVMDLISRIFS